MEVQAQLVPTAAQVPVETRIRLGVAGKHVKRPAQGVTFEHFRETARRPFAQRRIGHRRLGRLAVDEQRKVEPIGHRAVPFPKNEDRVAPRMKSNRPPLDSPGSRA
jgi:hypothetical protein